MGAAPSFDIVGMLMTPINWLKDTVQKIKDFVDDFDSMIQRTVIDPMLDGFRKIDDWFKDIGDKLGEAAKALGDIFVAIGYTFYDIFEAMRIEAIDVGNIIYGGGKCLIQFTGNFRRCAIFWTLDCGYELLYSLFILLPVWVIDAMAGTNLMKYIRNVNGYIESVDEEIKKFTGFSIIHYPPSVINDCYVCKGVDFTKLVDRLNSDNVGIKKSFDDLTDQYTYAGNRFTNAFK